MKNWVFLSPHFDDAVLSAGGMIWELANRGDGVEIWTICAGDPPSGRQLTDYAQMLHIFWELGETDVPYSRSLEDAASCRLLGAGYRRYTVPDNIYRYLPGTDEPVTKVPDDNAGPLEPNESYLIPPVTDFLRKNLVEGYQLVTPLSVGHHRDHVLTRTAADRLGIPLWHFVDYPYVTREPYDPAEWIPPGVETFSLELSAAAVQAWKDAIACYKSQMIFLFPDAPEMHRAIEEYASSGGGCALWKF